MTGLGKHLIVELYGCDRTVISDIQAMERHLLEAVRLSGATIIQPFFHHFPPDGVSGIVVVAESHFSIHTWPELGYAALDIFTCGDLIKGYDAVDYLKKHLKAGDNSVIELERGLADRKPPDSLHGRGRFVDHLFRELLHPRGYKAVRHTPASNGRPDRDRVLAFFAREHSAPYRQQLCLFLSAVSFTLSG
ncbi:MAG: adenosylmethionine decarboxylase [Deltaproteobacteria bacterium]|nr:adenosylmethionine decarboxylase [Deltaproteobacteria bacterium]